MTTSSISLQGSGRSQLIPLAPFLAAWGPCLLEALRQADMAWEMSQSVHSYHSNPSLYGNVNNIRFLRSYSCLLVSHLSCPPKALKYPDQLAKWFQNCGKQSWRTWESHLIPLCCNLFLYTSNILHLIYTECSLSPVYAVSALPRGYFKCDDQASAKIH